MTGSTGADYLNSPSPFSFQLTRSDAASPPTLAMERRLPLLATAAFSPYHVLFSVERLPATSHDSDHDLHSRSNSNKTSTTLIRLGVFCLLSRSHVAD